jgi:hypothetical protein
MKRVRVTGSVTTPLSRPWALLALLALLLSALAFPARAQTVTIGFDDGANGAAVGATYAAQGVTFTNATYVALSPVLGPNAIASVSGGLQFGQANAIVAVFDKPVDAVSITTYDAGAAGARIDAYDAVAGGTLIGHDEYIGTGDGFGTIKGLSVSGAGIRRIELYQPAYNGVDGVLFDNLRVHFTPPPDTTAPTVTATASKTTLWPPNGQSVPVTISGTIIDNAGGSGVDLNTVNYTVKDEYGKVQPAASVTLATDGSYSFTVKLTASRKDTDMNGRTYTITVSAKDLAGNMGSKSVVVTVPHNPTGQQGQQGQ